MSDHPVLVSFEGENLPATGDHEIAVIVGHPATRTYLRDRISVVP
ncbi:MAG: hypothetical protein R3E66_17690 [bacterium]